MGILIHEPEVKWTAAQATARRRRDRQYKSVMRCEFCHRMPVVGFWRSGQTQAGEDREMEMSPVCQSCGDWIALASYWIARLKGEPELCRFENWPEEE